MKKKNLFLLALVSVLSLGGCSFFNLLPESSTEPTTESDTSVESTSIDESSSESSSSSSEESSESSSSEESSSTSSGPVVLVEEIKIYDGNDPSHPLHVAVSTYVQLQVHVVVFPSNATDKSLSWESDDPTVADVSMYYSEWADVFGLKLGTTKITFTANDGSGVSACIYVETYEVPITGLELLESETFEEKYEVNLNVGDTYYFYASATPYATPNHKTYPRELTSSEKQYISLTKDQYENYEVTALKAGEVTIRIYSEANNAIYRDLVVTIV